MLVLRNVQLIGAVLISLFFIKAIPIEKKSKKNTKMLEEIKDGLKYIYHKDILLYTLLVMAIVGTFAPNFNVLVPVFAKEILNQNETGFGILMSFMGLGSFIGAIFMASLSKTDPKRFVIYIVPLIIGALLIVTGFTNIYLMTGINNMIYLYFKI